MEFKDNVLRASVEEFQRARLGFESIGKVDMSERLANGSITGQDAINKSRLVIAGNLALNTQISDIKGRPADRNRDDVFKINHATHDTVVSGWEAVRSALNVEDVLNLRFEVKHTKPVGSEKN